MLLERQVLQVISHVCTSCTISQDINLSFVSKTVERLEVNRLAAHANQHSLLPVCQSAYRQHHSIENAVTSVHNDIVRATDEGLASALVLLDLGSAFDTVDHELLIDVLRDRFGIEQHELEWFRSYHTGRSPTFKAPNNSSGPVSLTCGVSQGSRIGTQEFTVYTEDMADTIDSFNIGHHFYTDDSQLLTHMSLTAVPQHRRRLELCVEHLKDWCSSRRLQLNRDKKELIWFGFKSKLVNLKQLDTNLNIYPVTPSSSNRPTPSAIWESSSTASCQCLGTSANCRQVAFFQLRRLRQFRWMLDPSSRQQLVSAFILSRIDFCNAVLAGLRACTFAPLQRVLHAAARFVAGLPALAHINDTIRSLH